jgi:crotonobetainyl-CoA:carnitine CoA-transferase CaiB-like acyl-CoA transferase
VANHHTTQIWPCKDGWVSWSHGGVSPLAASVPLIKWMESEGYDNDYVSAFDWNRRDFSKIPQEDMDQIEEPTARFFMAHTKAELLEGAVARNVMLYPVSTTADIMENRQLKAREFWAEVEHPELGTTITYPGAFVRSSEASPSIWRRAPLIGEHNQEIYVNELGITIETLVTLKQAGVI